MKASERLAKEDPFLTSLDDLNKTGTIIHCARCREPLWKQRILKSDGIRPVSTETLPFDGVQPFSDRIEKCAFCCEKFYVRSKNGGQMYLIQDCKSGVTRLI